MAMANAMNLCDQGVEQTLEELLPKPVDSKEEFMVLETRLIAEEDYIMKLVQNGKNLAKTMRGIIRKLLTNNLMSSHSLTGQKGKERFLDTKVFRVVMKASRKAANSQFFYAEHEYEVGEVLRNVPNYPGGSNFVKKKKEEQRKSSKRRRDFSDSD